MGYLKNSFFNHKGHDPDVRDTTQRKALCGLCGFHFVVFAVKTINHKGKCIGSMTILENLI